MFIRFSPGVEIVNSAFLHFLHHSLALVGILLSQIILSQFKLAFSCFQLPLGRLLLQLHGFEHSLAVVVGIGVATYNFLEASRFGVVLAVTFHLIPGNSFRGKGRHDCERPLSFQVFWLLPSFNQPSVVVHEPIHTFGPDASKHPVLGLEILVQVLSGLYMPARHDKGLNVVLIEKLVN